MNEFLKASWLILFGINVCLLVFSLTLESYSLAALNILSAISFLVGYFAVKNREDSSEEEGK